MDEREQYCKHRLVPLSVARSAGCSRVWVPRLGSASGFRVWVQGRLSCDLVRSRILLTSASLCVFLCASLTCLSAQSSVPARRAVSPMTLRTKLLSGVAPATLKVKSWRKLAGACRSSAPQPDRQKDQSLVALAAEHSRHVHSSGKAGPEDGRLPQDIQQRARSVKDRMRGF